MKTITETEFDEYLTNAWDIKDSFVLYTNLTNEAKSVRLEVTLIDNEAWLFEQSYSSLKSS